MISANPYYGRNNRSNSVSSYHFQETDSYWNMSEDEQQNALEKNQVSFELSYGGDANPMLEVHVKDREYHVPELLHVQILKLADKIEGILRFGIENGIITEVPAQIGGHQGVFLLESAHVRSGFLLPAKQPGSNIDESLLAQYHVTLEKCGFVDDLDDDLLKMGTTAGLPEYVVRKEMAERAVNLFLRDLDPYSGSILKVSRARKIFDFIDRIGIEWIKAAPRYPSLRETAERILLYPVPRSDPLKNVISDLYSQILNW